MAMPHYAGTYQRRAKALRDAANADPSTTCWRCGRTQSQHGQPWQAGHLNDGEVDGALAAECRGCNAKAGGKHGAALRDGFRRTRDW